MTTTEEVIRLTREVADASLNDPVVGSSIVLDIGEMKRLIKLVKAEENEACAKDAEIERLKRTPAMQTHKIFTLPIQFN